MSNAIVVFGVHEYVILFFWLYVDDNYLALKKQRIRFMELLRLSEGGNLNYNKRTMIDRLNGNYLHDRSSIRSSWQCTTMLARGHYALAQKEPVLDPTELMKVGIICCCNYVRLAIGIFKQQVPLLLGRKSYWTIWSRHSTTRLETPGLK